MSALTDQELQAITEAITESVLIRVKREFGAIFTRLDTLEKGAVPSTLLARIAELEARPVGLKYCGVWSSTATYETHEAVTWGGSLWVALGKSTAMKPGDSPGAWQLAVKRGSDGKGV